MTAKVQLNVAKHHPEFYFPDGNICLIVQDATIFRVFKSQLARRSSVFADMIAIPESDDQDMYDSVPSVALDDSAQDVAELFDLLWNPPYVNFKPR